VQHFSVLNGLRQSSASACRAEGRGEYRQALALGAQCLDVGQRLQDPALTEGFDTADLCQAQGLLSALT
jgi:hypothetical protein